jgi:predicted RNA-binding Zn-ribbon protein involved in translation (DUF1610 family)
MKVITVKQPWAYLLCAGIKDIENRTWKLPEKYRGKRVLIHASAKPAFKLHPLSDDLFTKEQWMAIPEKQARKIIDELPIISAIIGSVRFVDCVVNHPSIWAEETSLPDQLDDKCVWNWVVADPILFDKPLLKVKGKLRFWNKNYEEIICPECGQIQCAKVKNTSPFMTYIHECDKCGYTIMESEWDRVK